MFCVVWVPPGVPKFSRVCRALVDMLVCEDDAIEAAAGRRAGGFGAGGLRADGAGGGGGGAGFLLRLCKKVVSGI